MNRKKFFQNIFFSKYYAPTHIKNKSQFSGIISKLFHYNEDYNFFIGKLELDSNDEIIIKGKIIEPVVGQNIKVQGQWKHNKTYGDEFNIISYKTVSPLSKDGIIRYLGSGLIKNVRETTAKKVVDYFGLETLNIIENFPKRLSEVPGIGRSKTKDIIQGYAKQKSIKEIMLFLAENNINTKYGFKLFNIYGEKVVEKLKNNPYRLIRDVSGVAFKKADHIASKLGIEPTDPVRIINSFVYLLNEGEQQGHSFLLKDDLIKQSKNILNIAEKKILELADKEILLENYDIKCDESRMYLIWNYYYEIGISNKLLKLQSAKFIILSNITQKIFNSETQQNLKLSEEQRNAVKKCLKNKLVILTGGPGTGKTTITRILVNILADNKISFKLASPTGRASKRLEEVTGFPTYTIHKLLEYSSDGTFKRNTENPLKCDAIIIDEASMINNALFFNLLKALPDNIKILLIGDIDQLPSVGAGDLLNDLIKSSIFSVVRLKHIYRQAKNSDIIVNAHKINKGQQISQGNNKKSDFFFMEMTDPEKISKEIVDLVVNRLPSYYSVDSTDIQVLCPMYKSVIGVNNLNILLQEKLNHKSKTFNFGYKIFKIGDKVIQLKNNYDKNIMNGDIGKIIAFGTDKDSLVSNSIDKNKVQQFITKNSEIDFDEKLLLVDFDDIVVCYDKTDLDEFSLAYAITIHKSQGSEFEIIIMPVSNLFYIMLNRNILYTGLTRAKKIAIMIGSRQALDLAIKNYKIEKRNSYLCSRIINELSK